MRPHGLCQRLLSKTDCTPKNANLLQQHDVVRSPANNENFFQDKALVTAMTNLCEAIIAAQPKFEIVFVGSEKTLSDRSTI